MAVIINTTNLSVSKKGNVMTEKKVTIHSLLTEDNRKRLAELLLNNGITDMVVIYRKENDLLCHSSNGVTANVIGMVEMAKTLVMEDWLHPIPNYSEICEDDDQDSEDEAS
jgi:hypothetical protein